MCLRRIIKPNITPDEVCYCAYEDVHRFFDNSDGVFNSEYYKRNCERAFSMTLDEIEAAYSKDIAWSRSRRPKFILKRIYGMDSSTRNSMIKKVYDSEISRKIDTSLPIDENLDKMKKQGIDISRSRLYNYYKEHNLKTNPKKLSDNDIINLLDVNLSVRKNLSALKAKGIKISIKRICRLLKGIKE